MELFLRFAALFLLYIFLPLVVVLAIARRKFRRQVTYGYSLGAWLSRNNFVSRHPHTKILYVSRLLTLLILALLIARPQLVDYRSKVEVEGIDMMLVLDVSGSMQFDDFGDQRQRRIDVAKNEAVRFIIKRDRDPIGLVLFGKNALSRCPLTLDKNILTAMVRDLDIGVVDPDGTVLATAILTAANRLKNSQSVSKVMILLTDGEPSQGDSVMQTAIDVSKQLGIKIYTIGIGSDKDIEVVDHRSGFRAIIPKVNTVLLGRIAQETGGRAFLARSPHDMRAIYDTIDSLEKTTYETDLFSRYYDIFMPIVGALLFLMLAELLAITFWWFSL